MPGMVMTPADAPKARTGLNITNTEADGVMISKVNNSPVEFQEYEMADYGPPMIEGWDGLTLERRNDSDNASQILYAYTDIAATGSETFLEKYGKKLSGGKLMVGMDSFAPAKSASFPTRTEGEVRFPGGTAGVAFAGTYDGVAGEFLCSSSGPCVVMADTGTGKLSLDGTESFTFTPTSLSSTIVKGDGDYLYFGYWLHKPDAPGGAHMYSLFAGGNDMFTVRGDNPRTALVEEDDADRSSGTTPTLREISYVEMLAGEARYSGPAAGKYVTRDLAANTAQIGLFTATTELHVDFDATSTWAQSNAARSPVTGGGMVDGVIKDFMEGDESLGNWRIMLGDASLAAIGQADTTMLVNGVQTPTGMTPGGESNTQFVGEATARIGAASASGDWVGTFHGNDRTDAKPEAIAGMFEVSAAHAALSGAFGAYNTGE